MDLLPRPARLSRRHWIQSACAASVGAWLPQTGRAAASYPDHAIRLIVPSAAGGSPDAVCRLLTAELAKTLGQALLVDNKPGASGNIGMADVFRAVPDGYTFGYANVGTLAINKALFPKLPY